MNIVDRLLNGEFEDDNEEISIQSTKTSSMRGSKGTFAKSQPAPTPDPDEDEETDEDEQEWDESDWEIETGEDIDDSVVISDPDMPSEEYCRKVMQSIDPDSVVEEEVASAPKNSEFKNKKKAMSTPETPKTKPTVDSNPKNSTAENIKPGRPAKLSAHTDEVVRLYNEGLSAKGIADQYSVSISCVFNCLKAAGVAIRPRGRRKTK